MYADDFYQIAQVLRVNGAIRSEFERLVAADAIAGKITEGEGRVAVCRQVLLNFASGLVTVNEAIAALGDQLGCLPSPHATNRHVFADGWPERLVRTQISRFYNQSVMGLLIRQGEVDCFVPHSSHEKADSPCSVSLAGKRHPLQPLYDSLISSYRDGNWNPKVVKVPNHPHCTHVVRPADS